MLHEDAKKGLLMEEKMSVKQAKRGDTDAFAKLYEKVYLKLYRYAYYLLKSTEDAEDCVSETVMDAFSGIGNLRKEESFEAWIFQILSVKCRRKMKEYYERGVELTEDIPEKAEGIAESEKISVRQAVFQLEEEEREIVLLHQVFGYRTREIAGMLSLNENTVRSKESRALKKLAKMLLDERKSYE